MGVYTGLTGKVCVAFVILLILLGLSSLLPGMLPIPGRYAVAQEYNYGIKMNLGFGKNLSYPIPRYFLGVGGVGSSYLGRNSSVLSTLLKAGFRWTRLEAQLEAIFPNSEQNAQYASIDAQLSTALSSGFQNIVVIIDYTPSWLVNNTGFPCKDVNHYPPSNYTEWGKLASYVVKHIDRTFHTKLIYYEIWNEPDASVFLCVSPSIREKVYFNIFDAAAIQIRGNSYQGEVEIGGPALANPFRDTQMVYDFVHNSTISRFVDFVSYHHYAVSGIPDSWNGTNLPVYAAMQGAATGYAQIYNEIASIVHHGSQPNASRTPVFITEYNTDTVGPDCCGSSKVYSPLFNSLFVTDLFNSIYASGSDHSLPAGFTYFTLSAPSIGICMFGSWDTNMDCAVLPSPKPQPYPQFYSYYLLGGANYLDLTSDNYLAPSITSSLAGVSVLGFFNATSAKLLIVNAGIKAYENATLFVENPPGYASGVASLFGILDNGTNEAIVHSNIDVRQVNGGYALNLYLKPLSVYGMIVSFEQTGSSSSSAGSTLSSSFTTSYTTTTLQRTSSGTSTESSTGSSTTKISTSSSSSTSSSLSSFTTIPVKTTETQSSTISMINIPREALFPVFWVIIIFVAVFVIFLVTYIARRKTSMSKKAGLPVMSFTGASQDFLKQHKTLGVITEMQHLC